VLAKRADDNAAATPTPTPKGGAAQADDGGGWTQAAKDMVFGTKRRQGMIEAFAKSAVRNAAGQLGRSLLRGVLGSLKR
jgi:hypothetical protein